MAAQRSSWAHRSSLILRTSKSGHLYTKIYATIAYGHKKTNTYNNIVKKSFAEDNFGGGLFGMRREYKW